MDRNITKNGASKLAQRIIITRPKRGWTAIDGIKNSYVPNAVMSLPDIVYLTSEYIKSNILNMTIDQVYYKLRSIGCSVETSDALAPIVAELSDKKREAFFLWACGMNNCEVAKYIGCDEKTIRNMIKKIRIAIKKYSYIDRGAE